MISLLAAGGTNLPKRKKNSCPNRISLPSNCIVLHKHLGGRASPHGTKHEMGDKTGLYAEFQ